MTDERNRTALRPDHRVSELLARTRSPAKYSQIGKGMPMTIPRPASNEFPPPYPMVPSILVAYCANGAIRIVQCLSKFSLWEEAPSWDVDAN